MSTGVDIFEQFAILPDVAEMDSAYSLVLFESKGPTTMRLRVFVPARDLRQWYTGEIIAEAIREKGLRCIPPRCHTSFAVYQHLHIMQHMENDPEGKKRGLVHIERPCVAAALAAGWEVVRVSDDEALNLLLSTLGLPTLENPPPLLSRGAAAHSNGGKRAPQPFVRHFAAAGHH